MNFKRNILGLAVVTAISGVSLPAISADLNAPDAVSTVKAEAPLITSDVFDTAKSVEEGASATVLEVRRVLTLVNDDTTELAQAQGNLQANAAAILKARTAISDAEALTAGQLIGGETATTIITNALADLGENADGTEVVDANKLLQATAGLELAVTNATSELTKTQGELLGLTTGTISESVFNGLNYADIAATQQGLVDGKYSTAVTDATTALGSDTDDKTALSLYGKKAFADDAVTNAAYAEGDGDVVITGQAGTKGTETFVIANADDVDIRDDDTQVLFTVDTAGEVDLAGNVDALVLKINGTAGLSVTAAASATPGQIVLTYDDAATSILATTDADFDQKRKVNVTGVTAESQSSDAGLNYVADSTKALNLADKKLLQSEAASALAVGIADVTAATNSKAAAQTIADGSVTTSEANLKVAADKMAVIDSVLQEIVAVEAVEEARLEDIALTSEAATDADIADVSSTSDALSQATADKTIAQNNYDEAETAYIATPNAENALALTEANAALATAITAESSAQSDADAAIEALYGPGKTAATPLDQQNGTLATSTSDRKDVSDQQDIVQSYTDARALQATIAADPANPAIALQAGLIAGTDTGGDVVAAVNGNFQLTKTNAAGIAANVATLAVHEGLVTTNIANIATNTTNIATNTANIATNTADIATNTADIATNAANIVDLDNGLTEGMANLQRVEMQMNENVDMLKSGIASALAIAGMPTAPGEGMGFSVGTGYFDGESAVAMGLTFVDGSRSYKLSLGHSGGETSASAGAAFKF